MADDFRRRIAERDVVVGVVGLGYVGLSLAIAYAESGFRAIGLDVDPELAASLNRGTSHIVDVVSSDRVARTVEAGRFEATATPSALVEADAVFICVPTPFDLAKIPDLSFVRAATHSVAEILRPGMLVILQSTTYPGTTTEIVQPLLEERGLRAGDDFHLAFSPERVDPGNTTWTVHNTPKVVGGLTPECSKRAQALLEAVMDGDGLVKIVSNPASAEMAKLLENTYRAVNIALVNELAMLAHEMGIDVWEVIDAAASKPFGFQAFYPGIGPGGHCIPVDPHYLSWKAREFDFQTKFIEVAADVNSGMARYVVMRLHELMNRHGRALNGAKALCLGAAFKPGVSDVRNSRAIRVMELLEHAGAHVEYIDIHVPTLTLPSGERKSFPVGDVTASGFDLAVVLVGGADWPLDALDAAGVIVFDAVNAGGPGGETRERL
ncbi:MAG: nucleotide sugar dehydrogenase [Actinobacteria bacterium]|nr:nucleotide sugar dehydrogenase [Actinomycetota bacterium]